MAAMAGPWAGFELLEALTGALLGGLGRRAQGRLRGQGASVRKAGEARASVQIVQVRAEVAVSHADSEAGEPERVQRG